MTRGVRLYLVGSFVLVSLAGCGRGFFQSAEREPWRAEAEIACLKSGAVKENAELVRINPISGPGVCGAEFPLKVAALGEGSSSFGFADEICGRPADRQPAALADLAPPPAASPYPDTTRCDSRATARAKRSDLADRARRRAARKTTSTCRPRARRVEPGAGQAAISWAYHGDSGLSAARPRRRALFAASRCRREFPQAQPLPRLGPAQGNSVTAFGPVAVKPAATLACPIVSVLDRWLADSVQPAAHALVRRARRSRSSRSRPIPAAA